MYIHTYIGALSATDNDDDYCVSYTVTMVDVRSSARPPRSPSKTFCSNHTSKYVCICNIAPYNKFIYMYIHNT